MHINPARNTFDKVGNSSLTVYARIDNVYFFSRFAVFW